MLCRFESCPKLKNRDTNISPDVLLPWCGVQEKYSQFSLSSRRCKHVGQYSPRISRWHLIGYHILMMFFLSIFSRKGLDFHLLAWFSESKKFSSSMLEQTFLNVPNSNKALNLLNMLTMLLSSSSSSWWLPGVRDAFGTPIYNRGARCIWCDHKQRQRRVAVPQHVVKIVSWFLVGRFWFI